MFKFLKSIGSAVKVVSTVDRLIKEFPNQAEKDIKYLTDYVNSQPYEEVKSLDKRIQEKFTTKINESNFIDYTAKYLEFYSKVFPNQKPDLIPKFIEDTYEQQINDTNFKESGENYLKMYQLVAPNSTSEKLTQKLNHFKFYDFLNSKIIDDEALSPDEINEIVIKSKELNIEDNINEVSLRTKYSYYVRNWEIDNGIFPNIQAEYLLNKNEFCVFNNYNTSIYETKLVTQRVSYGGPSVRIKIMKGVYYKAGGYNISSYKSERNILIGSGILNLTNERIILKTNLKIVTIKLKDIIHIEPYTDGIVISKASGKPFIFQNEETILFYQYLTGLIKKYYSS